VGIPWLDKGRDREGCDCWGLARLVYREMLGVELPSYDGDYVSAGEQAEIDAAIVAARSLGNWHLVKTARSYDLALFRHGRHVSHIGIVVLASGLILHMMGEDSSKIESVSAPQHWRRLVGFYRYASRT